MVPRLPLPLCCCCREVELRPGGKSEPVTWANRKEYADLVTLHRLTESKQQVRLLSHARCRRPALHNRIWHSHRQARKSHQVQVCTT
jgi:hypothetical protein